MAEKILALTTDGRLTFCTASPENRGKGRCNHATHILPGETTQKFLFRVAEEKLFPVKEVMMDLPIEIQHLNEALLKLDKKIKEPLEIRVVGGYASCHMTNNATKDLDSCVRLSAEIQSLVDEVSDEMAGNVEKNWLNDEVLRFAEFSDKETNRLLQYINSNPTETTYESTLLPGLEKLKVYVAKPSILMCMKYAATKNRTSEKDVDDFKKIIKFKKYKADEIIKIMKDDYSMDFEKSEIATDLFMWGIIGEEEWSTLVT